jgi:hypothetical protein
MALLPLDDFRERGTRPVAQGVEPHIAADTRREIGAVGLAQRTHQGVPTLVADFAIHIPATVIEAGSAVSVFRHFSTPFVSACAMRFRHGIVDDTAMMTRNGEYVNDTMSKTP